ncbi:hypothetical protein FKP32DRAFT_1597366 [Trametes sanguinea]|nr:hypothetical protein FKP32DRAFT_1597366 [Trametes sanguinea]
MMIVIHRLSKQSEETILGTSFKVRTLRVGYLVEATLPGLNHSLNGHRTSDLKADTR